MPARRRKPSGFWSGSGDFREQTLNLLSWSLDWLNITQQKWSLRRFKIADASNIYRKYLYNWKQLVYVFVITCGRASQITVIGVYDLFNNIICVNMKSFVYAQRLCSSHSMEEVILIYIRPPDFNASSIIIFSHRRSCGREELWIM